MNTKRYAKPQKCPECSWAFQEISTAWGIQRQCTGCTVRQWCTNEGVARATPANAFVRRARMKAHAAFDRLWREGPYDRKTAYAWLAQMFGLTEVHMAELGTDDCERVVKLSERQWEDIQEELRVGRGAQARAT